MAEKKVNREELAGFLMTSNIDNMNSYDVADMLIKWLSDHSELSKPTEDVKNNMTLSEFGDAIRALMVEYDLSANSSRVVAECNNFKGFYKDAAVKEFAYKASIWLSQDNIKIFTAKSPVGCVEMVREFLAVRSIKDVSEPQNDIVIDNNKN